MVKIGDEVKLEIVDYTYDGLGVGKLDGFPIFVANTVIGETILTRVEIVKKNLAFGKALKTELNSERRVKPVCVNYSDCGGCQIMHMSYKEQLSFKTNHVKETLKRVGNIDTPVSDCIGMDYPYRYRNKLAIPFSNGESGLYKQGTHDIVSIEKCHILNREAFRMYSYIKDLELAAKLKHLVIRNSYFRNQYMIVLVSDKPLKDDITMITEKFANVVSIVNNINPGETNVILGKKSNILHGEDYYEDYLIGNSYQISHRSFYQVNPAQTEKLFKKVMDTIDYEDKTIVDAYSGIGTIGISLSLFAKYVHCIEVNEDAVNAGKESIRRNYIDNVEFHLGKAEELISTVLKEDVDVVITDPPRKGCDELFIDALIKSKIKEVIYISCNVSTLARDLKLLADFYDVVEVAPFDMFPQTYHTEVFCYLKRK